MDLSRTVTEKNGDFSRKSPILPTHCVSCDAACLFTAYIMLLIAMYYRRCGRNLRAKLCIAINSLSANHVYLKTVYYRN